MTFDQINELNAMVHSLKLALEQYREIASKPKRRPIDSEYERGYTEAVQFLADNLQDKIDEISRQVQEMLGEANR